MGMATEANGDKKLRTDCSSVGEVVIDQEIVYPSEEFRASSWISSREQYDEMYKRSVEDPDAFWGEEAKQFFWETIWDYSDGNIHSENFDVRKGPINIEWFKGGKTNICYNALDRHVKAGKGDAIAMYWEGNDPEQNKKLSYKEVLDNVCQLANFLRSVGVKKGDLVAVYLPMLAELPIAMLACARIGAIHTVIFGGFSADALAQRLLASRAKVLITTSGYRRGDKVIRMKQIVEEALSRLLEEEGHSIETCLTFAHDSAVKRQDAPWTATRDVWWQDVVPKYPTVSRLEWVDAEDPLFLLYTSGSTGAPKGIVHTTGGYMVYTAATFKYTFDYHEGEVYWCTADCGWITGHSYLTYGPFLNAATVLVFEGVNDNILAICNCKTVSNTSVLCNGASVLSKVGSNLRQIPTYPTPNRCWDVIDKYNVNILYTAPTAIRSLMRFGDGPVKTHQLKSLRLLGSVGEPINRDAWRWLYEVVGNGRCPIVDTWWQTETGGFLITPLPGAWSLKPGSATLPFFSVQPAILDPEGNELSGEATGVLCLKGSWPGVCRTILGDHKRYEMAYFSHFKGYYFSGDGCHRDKDGYYWLTGRVDDVINVSGHRIGTAEVESALASHPMCAEAAVVGYDHQVKGQGIYAFVALKYDTRNFDKIRQALITTVREQIGTFAAPDKIHFVPSLPKTTSGKTVRRILRKIAAKQLDDLGDISTLANPQVVEQIIAFTGN